MAGHNLGILMRLLVGAGTPREAVARGRIVYLFFVYAGEAVAIFLVVPPPDGFVILLVAVTADPG